MFGHQDDTNNANTSFLHDAAPTWSSTPAAPAADPAPQLLETQATDGYVTTPPTPASVPVSAPDNAAPAPPVSQTPTAPADELIDIKQQALQQLSPLVGQLDQSPEEKFRTTMMLIQASDNQALLKEAFAAAQQISDDKQRAQALLDVINEINYFTQQNGA